jgi:hypothetical protein
VSRLSTKQRRARTWRRQLERLRLDVQGLEDLRKGDDLLGVVVAQAATVLARHFRFKIEELETRYGKEAGDP